MPVESEGLGWGIPVRLKNGSVHPGVTTGIPGPQPAILRTFGPFCQEQAAKEREVPSIFPLKNVLSQTGRTVFASQVIQQKLIKITIFFTNPS